TGSVGDFSNDLNSPMATNHGGLPAIAVTIHDPSLWSATYNQRGPGDILAFTFNSQTIAAFVGQFDIHVANADGFVNPSSPSSFLFSYCVDLNSDVHAGDTFPFTPGPASTSLPNGPEISYLFNRFGAINAPGDPGSGAAVATDADHCAALQQAIWK